MHLFGASVSAERGGRYIHPSRSCVKIYERSKYKTDGENGTNDEKVTTEGLKSRERKYKKKPICDSRRNDRNSAISQRAAEKKRKGKNKIPFIQTMDFVTCVLPQPPLTRTNKQLRPSILPVTFLTDTKSRYYNSRREYRILHVLERWRGVIPNRL